MTYFIIISYYLLLNLVEYNEFLSEILIIQFEKLN